MLTSNNFYGPAGTRCHAFIRYENEDPETMHNGASQSERCALDFFRNVEQHPLGLILTLI